MSHFTTVKTKWTDAEAMCAALKAMGFRVLKSDTNSLDLLNYYGQKHSKQVCLRAVSDVGMLSGKSQLGFVRQKDGTLSVELDGGDRNKPWYKQLPQQYSYAKTMAELRAKGYSVAEDKTDEKGHIHVRAIRAH